jgi:type II secretory pathway pseudopilin PulG
MKLKKGRRMLLIAGAIMLVLAALVTVGISKAISTDTLGKANDIRQLQVALENFKTKHGRYPNKREAEEVLHSLQRGNDSGENATSARR